MQSMKATARELSARGVKSSSPISCMMSAAQALAKEIGGAYVHMRR